MDGRRSGVVLRSLTGERFRFDSGALCLDFALTGGEGYRAAYEKLFAPADLERWIEATFGIVVVPLTVADLADAKRVREAVWQLAEARVEGRRLPGKHVGEVNLAAARPPLVPQIDGQGRRVLATPADVTHVLSTLARDTVELLTGPSANRIRRCTGADCTLIFVDTSRPGRRRWCSMERCGNRAKVGAFRNRQREEETP